MRTVHLGFGSNIEPHANLQRALAALADELTLTALSTIHRTPALRRPEDPEFLNACLAVETDLDPHTLKTDVLQRLEDETGRDRSADAYAPRPLDLDIVLDGDRCLDDELVTIPDPDVYERWFLARPLLEITGDVALPDTGRSLADVAACLEAAGEALPELTRQLRDRFHLPTPTAGDPETRSPQR
jgi:2-amino-4-hydroxy-6-hydroxymethyldihydropteridine diphosphokinase